MSDQFKVADNQYRTIGVTPMDSVPSRKRMLELMISKIKLLADRSRMT